MWLSDDLQNLLKQLQEQDFSSMEEYDAALTKIKFVTMSEHRRISTDQDGTRLSSVACNMITDFIVDTFFFGVRPEKDEREYKRVITRLRQSLMGYLKVTYGLSLQAPVYADVISELRVRLLAKEEIKMAIVATVGSQTLELVDAYRQRKIGTNSKECAEDDADSSHSLLQRGQSRPRREELSESLVNAV